MIIDPSLCHVKFAFISSIVGSKFLFFHKKKPWRIAKGQSIIDNLDTIGHNTQSENKQKHNTGNYKRWANPDAREM